MFNFLMFEVWPPNFMRAEFRPNSFTLLKIIMSAKPKLNSPKVAGPKDLEIIIRAKADMPAEKKLPTTVIADCCKPFDCTAIFIESIITINAFLFY